MRLLAAAELLLWEFSIDSMSVPRCLLLHALYVAVPYDHIRWPFWGVNSLRKTNVYGRKPKDRYTAVRVFIS